MASGVGREISAYPEREIKPLTVARAPWRLLVLVSGVAGLLVALALRRRRREA
jgi:hypothetical protein